MIDSVECEWCEEPAFGYKGQTMKDGRRRLRASCPGCALTAVPRTPDLDARYAAQEVLDD